MINRLVNKVCSGRFILTVFCGLAFYKLSVAKALPTEAVVLIMYAVFKDYFNRPDRKKEGL